MYCPNCGTETSRDVKFCRSCGMGLEPVSQMLIGQVPVDGEVGQRSSGSLEGADHRAKFLRWGFATFFAAGLLALFFLALGDLIGGRDGHHVMDLAELGPVIMLGGVGLMIYSRFFPKVGGRSVPPERPAPTPPKQIVDAPRPVAGRPVKDGLMPSITEHTTYSLDRPGTQTHEPGPERD